VPCRLVNNYRRFEKNIVTDVPETPRFSETWVAIYHLTLHKILEELNLHKDCCKKHISQSRPNTTAYPSADTLYFNTLLPTLCRLHLLQYKPEITQYQFLLVKNPNPWAHGAKPVFANRIKYYCSCWEKSESKLEEMAVHGLRFFLLQHIYHNIDRRAATSHILFIRHMSSIILSTFSNTHRRISLSTSVKTKIYLIVHFTQWLVT
jgi:hypothetical protein